MIPHLTTILIGLAVLGGVGTYTQYQRAERYQASVAPLQQAVRDADATNGVLRGELATCNADKVRMREANEKALEEAQRQREAAEGALEEFERRLGTEPADGPCGPILRVKVCPRLMDY